MRCPIRPNFFLSEIPAQYLDTPSNPFDIVLLGNDKGERHLPKILPENPYPLTEPDSPAKIWILLRQFPKGGIINLSVLILS